MLPDAPNLEWKRCVPVATRFGDPYYSLENGLAESRYVFLQGNRLPERFTHGFQIAELGFGTGLNAVSALAAWREAGVGGTLRMTSFELYPMARGDMERALSAFPEVAGEAADVLNALNGKPIGDLDLRVIPGDANQMLSTWTETADCWFLDGFAPNRNPGLWSAGLMEMVARHTRPDGTFATYTAAGAVRRALDAAGFDVVRTKGFGRKRHMTMGTLR